MMPIFSNSVLQDFWGDGVNCNKQGRSPRSRHEVARGEGGGTGRGGGVSPLPRWKENGNQEMLR